MQLRCGHCGGVVNTRVIANYTPSEPVKEFFKSVNWQRYGQRLVERFLWLTVYTVVQ